MDFARSARAALSLLLVVAMTSSSVAQVVEDRAYFRYRGGATSGTTTPPVENPDKDPLTILGAPSSVRARIGAFFQLVFTAQGAAGAVTWRVASGALPAGLTLDASTGILSGTPTALSSTPGVAVAAIDSEGAAGTSQSFAIDVSPVPSITVASSSLAEAGSAFSLSPNVSNVFGSRTFTLDGVLPFGVGLNATTGVISGTPEQDGAFEGLRLTVRDADGATGTSNTFSISVSSTMRVSGYSAQNKARAGSNFTSGQPTLIGGSGAATWALARGTLPDGLSLAPNGVISGTPSIVASTSGIYVRGTDTAGRSIVSPALAFDVAGAPQVQVDDGFRRVGSGHGITPRVTNGLGAGAFSIYAGALPSGVTLSPSSGAISGMASAGLSSGIQLERIDAFDGAIARSNPFSIETFQKLQAVNPSIPVLRVGAPVEIASPSGRGIRGVATWRVQGSLPQGLTFVAATGKIVGTPSRVETREISYGVTDNYDGASASSSDLLLRVTAAQAPGDLAITGLSSSYTAAVGRYFSSPTPLVANASGAVTFAVTSGALPGWAALNANTGQIFGTPTTIGSTVGVVLRATDAAGKADYSAPFSVTVREPSAVFAISGYEPSYSVPVGQSWSSGRPFIDGASPAGVSFSIVEGALPSWAALNPATGEIFGTPATTGAAFGLIVQASDSATGRTTRSAALDISAVPANSDPLLISGVATTYLAPSRRGFATNAPTVSGATGALSFALVGSLPSWATFNPATGVISGTPITVVRHPGLAVRVREVSTSKSALSPTFAIDVTSTDPLSASAPTTLSGVYDVAFASVPSSANAAGDVVWTLASGSLPSWARLNAATGAITGVPNAVGVTEGLSLKVADALGSEATTSTFAITIAPPPALAFAAMPKAFYAQVAAPFATQAPVASNARGAVSYSLASGALPAWAGLNATTGVISGTPTAIGTVESVAIRGVDSQGVAAQTSSFALSTAAAPLSITGIATSYKMRSGQPWTTATPSVSGNTDEISFSTTGGSKPPFAALDNATGAMGGVAVPGEWPGVVIKATEANTGRTALSSPFTVTVAQSAPSVVFGKTQALRTQTQSTLQLRSDTILGNATWAVATGSLPVGMTLNGSTGVISGAPSAVSTTTVTFRVTDSFDGVAGVSGPIEFVVEDGTPLVSYGAAIYGRVGQGINKIPDVSLTQGQNRFSIAAGKLPAWASLNVSTGAISGTPTAASSAADIGIAVTDGRGITGVSSSFAIDVAPQLAVSLVTTEVVARPNAAMATMAPVVTGSRGQVSWGLTGALPNGVVFDARSGVISGTISATGVYPLSITATDAFDNATRTVGFTLTGIAEPSLSAGNAEARVGFPFEFNPSASDTVGGLTWSSSGQIPPGLTLNASTGTISGTPTTVGSYAGLTLTLVDASGKSATSKPFAINVSAKVQIAFAGPYDARVGRAFVSAAPAATGAAGAVTWSLVGSRPTWLTVNPSTGVISGTANEAVSLASLKLRATDSAGSIGTSAEFALTFAATPNVAYASATPRLNAAVALAPTVTGVVGAGAYTLDAGTLPAGLTLNTASGKIAGVPTASGISSGLIVRVTDTDGAAGVSAPFSIQVATGIAFTAQPAGKTGRAGFGFTSDAPSITGANGALSWSIASGQLPAGLSMDQSGRISGVPTRIQTTTLALKAVDASDGASVVSSTFNFNILGSLTATTSAAFGGHVGRAFSSTAPVSAGARGAISWSLGAGALPSWATLNASTGVISGTPAVATTTEGLRLKATDAADGATGLTQAFTLSALPAVSVSNMATRYTARFGFPFSQAKPVLDNAFGAVSWTLATGTLPAWAALDPATGVISGTPDNLLQTAGLSLRGTDSTGAAATSVVFTLQAYSEPAVTIAQGSYTMRVGTSASIQPTSEGVFGSQSWSISQGVLPAGLTIDSATGLISGTPLTPQTQAVRIRLTDTADGKTAEAATSITVSPQLTLAGLKPDYMVRQGANLRTDVLEFGGVIGNRTLTQSTSPTLSGMQLDTAGSFYGNVAAAQAVGPYALTIALKDSFDNAVRNATSTITVVEALQVRNVYDVLLRSGAEAYTSTTPMARNQIGTITWELVNPNAQVVPTGLTFNPSTGMFTGVATQTFGVRGPYQLRATDSFDNKSALSANFYIRMLEDMVVGEPTTVDATANVTFTSSLMANSSYGAISWSATGLPNGLTIAGFGANYNEGRITGKTSSPGTYEVEVTATNRSDFRSVTKTFTLTVQSVPQLTVANASGTLGKAFTLTPAIVYGDDGDLSYSLSYDTTGNVGTGPTYLQTGLTFDPATGVISGEPTIVRTRTFRLKATKTKQVAGVTRTFVSNEVTFTIAIANWPIPVLARPYASGVVTTTKGAYFETPAPVVSNIQGRLSYRLVRGVSSGGNYSWQTATFVAGLDFNPQTGILFGDLRDQGTAYYAVIAVDTRMLGGVETVVESPLPASTSYGSTTTNSGFKLTIDPWPAPTVAHMGAVQPDQGRYYASPTPVVGNIQGELSFKLLQPVRIGTSANYQYVGEGVPPPGMEFDPETGVLSGAPKNSSNYYFAVQAVDKRIVGGETFTEVSALPPSGPMSASAAPSLTLQVKAWPLAELEPFNSTYNGMVGEPLAMPLPKIKAPWGTASYALYYGSCTGNVGQSGRSCNWSESGSLPVGVTFNSQLGILEGTPESSPTLVLAIVPSELREVAGEMLMAANPRPSGTTGSQAQPTSPFKITLNIANWPSPELVKPIDDKVAVRGDEFATETPQIKNPWGVASYRLFSGQCTGSVGSSGYSCFWLEDQLLPKGLTFNATTGVISGPSDYEMSVKSYAVAPVEERELNGRQVKVYGATPSGSSGMNATLKVPEEFTLRVTPWSTISAADRPDVRVPYGTSLNIAPPAVTGSYGTLSYVLLKGFLGGSGNNKFTFWSDITGSLPAGMQFNPTTGVISGTFAPAMVGNYSVVAVDNRVINGSTYGENSPAPPSSTNSASPSYREPSFLLSQ